MSKIDKIIPAIMPKDIADMQAKIDQVKDFVQCTQLDLMDGEFVPEATWLPYSDTNLLEDGEKYFKEITLDIELDLMVKNSMNKMDSWLTLHPKRIVFHLEAEEYIDLLFEPTRNLLTEVGIEMYMAVHVDTDMSLLEDYLPFLDGVQCMGIDKVGYQGQKFDERVLQKISEVRSIVGDDIMISIDGAVNNSTIEKLYKAGANSFVSGSYVYGGTPQLRINDLYSLIEK